MKVFTVYTCKTNKEINTGRQTKKNTLAKTNNEKRNVIKLLINKISNFLSSWRQSMSPQVQGQSPKIWSLEALQRERGARGKEAGKPKF